MKHTPKTALLAISNDASLLAGRIGCIKNLVKRKEHQEELFMWECVLTELTSALYRISVIEKK
jgi:hypothetical protein